MNQLTVAERDLVLSGLNASQQFFLSENLKRGKRTVFARHLVKQKGAAIPDDATFEEIESLLNEWVLTDYVDGGEVSKDLQCNCGRNLRYRYTVQHKNTGEVVHFGIDHLEQHLGIDVKTVAAVKRGFEAVDFELDEILLKLSTHWSIEKNVGMVPSDVQIPNDIQEHLDLGLPLLERQVARLREKIRDFNLGTWENVSSLEPVLEKKKDSKRKFDLFGETPDPAQQSGIQITTMELPYNLQQAAGDLIKSGVQSARIVCEHLIDKHFAPNRRFISSAKPHLFVPLCIWLDKQVDLGRMNLLSKNSLDRKYEWNNGV